MAMLKCEYCGRSFHAGVGRPPRTCPEHRGMKLARRDQYKAIEAPKAIEELPKDDGVIEFDPSNYRPNKYKGSCFVCSLPVNEGSGLLHRINKDEHSKAFHVDCLRTYLATNQESTPKPSQTQGELIKQIGEGDAMDAIQTLLKTLAPSIDEDGVKRIVTDAIGDQLSEERISNLVRQAGVQRIEISVNGVEVNMPETHHYLLPLVTQVIAAGEHVFLPGPAGSGKSTIAMQIAALLGLPFHSISFGPTTPTSKIFGFIDGNGTVHKTEFWKAYECTCDDETYEYEKCECGGLFLGDEIDNGHPGLTAELNQALANPYCAFATGMVRRGRKFVMVVTGNTFGTGPDRLYVGRNQLDAATLDRFSVIETPIDETMETRVASAYATGQYEDVVTRWIAYVQKVRANVNARKMQIVVSPRATIGGAKMLAMGMDWDTVANVRLFKAMNDETREMVR